MEVWKAVEGFPNYEVSNQGRVRRLYKTQPPKILKPCFCQGDYYQVGLRKDSKRNSTLIHRLVAKAFLPLVKDKIEINHINHIRTDNRVENLEWVDRSENMIKAKDKSEHRNIQITKYGNYNVVIWRQQKKIYDKTYKTLEEAVNARNEFLKIISE